MFKKLLLLLSLIALVDGDTNDTNDTIPCDVDSGVWSTALYCGGMENLSPCAETCTDVQNLLLNPPSSNCTAEWILVGNNITTNRTLSTDEINDLGFLNDDSSCAGCDGVANSGLVNDDCGVCDGDDSSCADCAGTPNGNAVEDNCEVCGGDGSSCDNTLRNWIILIVGACIVLAACLYCGCQTKNSSEDERAALLASIDRTENQMESQVKSLKF